MQKLERNKIILGGGISGLLQAYFNPDAVIISDQIGGQFSSKFQLGPKYLHVDKYTKKFLNELNITTKIKRIKIGFFYDGKLHSNNTEENRKKYFLKTRGETKKPYKSVMSADKTKFDSFNIDVVEIINKIKEKMSNESILEKAIKIDIDNKLITTKSKIIKYSNLISTIPLNTFLFLCNKIKEAKQYKSYPTTFIYQNTYKECPFNDFQDYDYVYVSEPEYLFHRITKITNGLVYEHKGDLVPISINDTDRVVMKIGQLVQNNIKIEYKNIKFCGRYAKWQHNLLVNDLLKELYER